MSARAPQHHYVRVVDQADGASSLKTEAIQVVYCNAAVQLAQQFGPSEPVQLEPWGGGGTDFRPAFDWGCREWYHASLLHLSN